jgi:hypothetical protein
MTRPQAWNFASFLSHATTARVPVPNANLTFRSTSIFGSVVTSQNATAAGTYRRRNSETMAPVYPFTGRSPRPVRTIAGSYARSYLRYSVLPRHCQLHLKEFSAAASWIRTVHPARLDPDNPPADP